MSHASLTCGAVPPTPLSQKISSSVVFISRSLVAALRNSTSWSPPESGPVKSWISPWPKTSVSSTKYRQRRVADEPVESCETASTAVFCRMDSVRASILTKTFGHDPAQREKCVMYSSSVIALLPTSVRR